MTRPSTASEFSAGGVVLDASDPPKCLVIVPTRRAADGSKVLALPKGHPEEGEGAQDAALREVREETGITADVIDSLGDVRYFYQRGGRRIAKVVRFYLLQATGGDFANHDHEVEDVRWMDLADAAKALSYKGEQDIVRRALSRNPHTG